MQREYFDVAVDGIGDVSMDIPDTATVDERLEGMLIKPLCVLCMHCPQDARAAFFAQSLANCELGVRETFENSVHSTRYEIFDTPSDYRHDKGTGIWYIHMSARCDHFELKD